MTRILYTLLLMHLLFNSPGWGQEESQDVDTDNRITIQKMDGGIEVRMDGQLFTRYHTNRETKPCFYPVLSPGQIPMTRGFPIEERKGEANDHPHHHSIWLGHEMNFEGQHYDFWANRGGIAKHTATLEINDAEDSFSVMSDWITNDGKVVCTVIAKYSFGFNEKGRWLDATHTFSATHGDFTFEDTKEGLFAIRTHPDLRLTPDPKRGVDEVFGNAVNSEGVSGKPIWGKAAKWVHYWGEVEGQRVGLGIFDHSANQGHPTRWHARDYGLIGANPIGQHHFTGAEKGAGELTIPNGESITFRHRMIFYAGDADSEQLEVWWQDYVR